MVEATQLKSVDVMEPQCDKRVVSGVLSSRLSRLKNLNSRCECGEYPSLLVWINVASPKINRVHLGIVECRPAAEKGSKPFVAFDEASRIIHSILTRHKISDRANYK